MHCFYNLKEECLILKTFQIQADGKEISKKTKKERPEENAERKLIICSYVLFEWNAKGF